MPMQLISKNIFPYRGWKWNFIKFTFLFFYKYLEEIRRSWILFIIFYVVYFQFGFDICRADFACDCIVIFDNRGISSTCIPTFPLFLSPANEQPFLRTVFALELRKNCSISTLIISTIHFYARSLRQRYYDERGNSSFRHSSRENGLSLEWNTCRY